MNSSNVSSQPESQPPESIAPNLESENENPSFCLVGIGASAGGLEAFTQFLGALPTDTGMAFVLLQHLEPNHTSLLTQLISRVTQMPVREVSDGMAVEPNHVYVMPPNSDMAIQQGELKLLPRVKTSGKYMPIDSFLRSLASAYREKAIAVILSGMDSDGSLGMEAIKAEGGITFAQTEASAQFPSMPNSSVASGCVDFILPPPDIALELVRISHHPYVKNSRPTATSETTPETEDQLQPILNLLRAATGVDFTYYKSATISRRIMRRMVLRQLSQLTDYFQYLQEQPDEVIALYQDVLIHVTRFFRNPEAFDALKQQVFPSLSSHLTQHTPIRVWIPGCSTGEEVYSMAISLVEFFQNQVTRPPIKIFGTDISDRAIENARSAIYTDKQLMEVEPERLSRFFVKVEGGYQIIKSIREMCIFAQQNVVQDPPFSKLDLLSCRNLLIYLEPVLQKKMISLFHYALKSTGFLMLGTSETTGDCSDLFALVDKTNKIYARKLAPTRLSFDFATSPYSIEKLNPGKKKNESMGNLFDDVQKEADRLVLSKYTPSGLIINEDLEILQFRGQTHLYLQPTPGVASLNLLKMVHKDLVLYLRTAINQAKRQKAPFRREGLQVKLVDQSRMVNIEVIPFQVSNSVEGYFLVLFEDCTGSMAQRSQVTQSSQAKSRKRRQSVEQSAQEREILHLQQELASTREYLQSMLEEQEATNEELRIVNEELLSNNEEYQSINEELETAKEKIQATNEELNTINDELQHRNQEINQVNNDLNNLLSSVNLPIVMLSKDMRIRLVTPIAASVLNITSADIGRSLSDIQLHFNIPDWDRLLSSSFIDTGSSTELEVQDDLGHWYDLRIRPYKTAENEIDGAVLMWVDIEVLKHSEALIRESRDYAEAIVHTVARPLIVLNAELRVKTANRSFYEMFQVTSEEIEGHGFFELRNHEWDIPRLRSLLEEILAKNTQLKDFEVTHQFLNLGNKTMLLQARRIPRVGQPVKMILLALEDITERKQMEQERAELLTREHEAREAAEAANRAKDDFLSLVSHDLRNPLSTILMWSQLLQTKTFDKNSAQKALETIERCAKSQSRLIEDLLDVARIRTGKLHLSITPVDLASVIDTALNMVRLSAEAKSLQVESVVMPTVVRVMGDAERLNQVIWNLVGNAIKFTPSGGRIEVRLSVFKELKGERLELGTVERLDALRRSVPWQWATAYAQITVSDNGIGIAPEVLPYIFDRFHQAESTISQSPGGLGLGLAIVRHLVELHGGTVYASSPGKGQGATFKVSLPLLG
jgi:two-component system CheB/CheR fusion protein